MPSRLNLLHERVHFHEVTVTSYPLFDPYPPYTLVLATKMAEVADKAVPAGTYVISAIPTKGDWTILLKKTDAKAEVEPIRFRARAHTNPHRERLTFLFSDFDDERASLELEWEKVRVSIPISVNTAKQVLTGIADLDTTWRSYANAARYMLETKKDYDAGLLKGVEYVQDTLRDHFKAEAPPAGLAAGVPTLPAGGAAAA